MEDVRREIVRKLATVVEIKEILNHPDADMLEIVPVRGWKIVVKKGEFKVGDKAIYCEIDSMMPDGLSVLLSEEYKSLKKKISKGKHSPEEVEEFKNRMEEIKKENTRPEFEFLRDKKFRIKTLKLRGVISQGILFPLSILDNIVYDTNLIEIDQDVTEILGVTKYEEPVNASLGGDAEGVFPGDMVKTDEERVENLEEKYHILKRFKYIKTEKLEGSSATFFLKNDEFGVCSRNLRLKETEGNSFWKVARMLNIEEKMREIGPKHGLTNFNIQGELIGEGIQKNIYRLKTITVRIFSIFDVDNQVYVDYKKVVEIIGEMGLEMVPILDWNYTLPETSEELLKLSDEFRTQLECPVKNQILGEGWVLIAILNEDDKVFLERSAMNRLSFKVKSREYLI